MKKNKILTGGLAVLLAFAPLAAFANEIPVHFEGNDTGKKGVIIDDRAYLPIRDAGEALAFKVDWNQKKREARMNKDERRVKFRVDEDAIEVYINDEGTDEIDCSGELVNIDDRLYVPLRLMADVSGYAAEWNAETRTVNFVERDIEAEMLADIAEHRKEKQEQIEKDAQTVIQVEKCKGEVSSYSTIAEAVYCKNDNYIDVISEFIRKHFDPNFDIDHFQVDEDVMRRGKLREGTVTLMLKYGEFITESYYDFNLNERGIVESVFVKNEPIYQKSEESNLPTLTDDEIEERIKEEFDLENASEYRLQPIHRRFDTEPYYWAYFWVETETEMVGTYVEIRQNADGDGFDLESEVAGEGYRYF